MTVVLSVLAMLAMTAIPAIAKEGAEAKLDTAIPIDAEPGSTLEVGWSVFSIVDGVEEPIYGSPVYIRLVAPDGRTASEVMGTERPSGSGHYVASIEVPAGGIGDVIVGMVGEACDATGCTRSDIIFPLTDDRLVGGAAPIVPTPAAPSASVGSGLLPIVGIGVAFAVAGSLAALLLGRRRVLGADPTGR